MYGSVQFHNLMFKDVKNMAELSDPKFFDAVLKVFFILIGPVIWLIRLEGRMNTQEKLFQQYVEHEKEKCDKIEKSIDDLFDITRRIETATAKIEGRVNNG